MLSNQFPLSKLALQVYRILLNPQLNSLLGATHHRPSAPSAEKALGQPFAQKGSAPTWDSYPIEPLSLLKKTIITAANLCWYSKISRNVLKTALCYREKGK